jgi:hypothetical protein
MTVALEFDNVDILFTGLTGRKREAAIHARSRHSNRDTIAPRSRLRPG